MKRILLLFITCLFFSQCKSTKRSGKVESFVINAKTLQNTGGENPNRKISVYLPPNYESTQKRFPVVYYLHGFMGNDSITTGMKAILIRVLLKPKSALLFWLLPVNIPFLKEVFIVIQP
jgi:enterochelin esterase-like enzyme